MSDDEGYRGPAKLTVGDLSFDVEVDLRGYFQPIDGRFHWYGRTASCEELVAALAGSRRSGVIETPEGTGPCELSEPDPWQRYRVSGQSTPPFRLPAFPAEEAP